MTLPGCRATLIHFATGLSCLGTYWGYAMDTILAGLISGLVLVVVVWIVQSLNVAPHWIVVGFVAGLIVSCRCKCKRTREAN